VVVVAATAAAAACNEVKIVLKHQFATTATLATATAATRSLLRLLVRPDNLMLADAR